jgi:hypothetical protein
MEGLFLREFLIDSIKERYAKQYVGPPTDEFLEKCAKSMSDALDRYQHCYLINCWHMNDDESQAMWKLYSKGDSNSIAIRSTAQRLWDCLGTWMELPRLGFRVIEYTQYEPGKHKWEQPELAIFHKDISLRHEQELRFVFFSHVPVMEGGRTIPIHDVATLIHAVYISPYADGWFKGVVENIMKQYGFPAIPVLPSRLSDSEIPKSRGPS